MVISSLDVIYRNNSGLLIQHQFIGQWSAAELRRSAFLALNSVVSRFGCLHPLTSLKIYTSFSIPISTMVVNFGVLLPLTYVLQLDLVYHCPHVAAVHQLYTNMAHSTILWHDENALWRGRNRPGFLKVILSCKFAPT